jgi:glycosyltransferase involved in cell wall biosynthesis/protein-tyrosine-phosphatase
MLTAFVNILRDQALRDQARPAAGLHSRQATGRAEVRVCHVMSADLWAGAEVQVATVASYLVEQPGVNLTAVLLNDGWLAHELRRLGVQVAIVDEHRYTALGIVRFLTRFLREHGVDVVHTHRHKDSVLGSIAAKAAGVPHVIRTVHGLSEPMHGWDKAKYQAYDALDRATLWCCADRILAVSRRMAETLKASGYRARTVTHLHNGVDLRNVKTTRPPEDVRRALGIEDDEVVIGTAGRFARVKGQAYLVRAARLVLHHEHRARFLFVGSGPLENELLESARHLGVDRRCLFIDPAVDRRGGIYDLVAAMDLFVLPSLNEGIPMALLEAMALARPVIASAVGGIPEVVTDRVTGLLVEPENDGRLANACLELVRNRRWAHTLGARARRVVERNFSHERNGRALLDLYRELVTLDGRAASATDIVMVPATRPTAGVLQAVSSLARRCVAHVRRKIEHARERRQIDDIRRNPSSLMATVKAAANILVVCHGNIIRSAFAARLMTQALGDPVAVTISSAGLEAVPGRPCHPTAVLTAAPRGVDLTGHTAAPVASQEVARADVIFVMDIDQLRVLRERFPEARPKTFLLTCCAPDSPLEIRDPVDGDESAFQACFDHITSAVHPIIRVLSSPVR